MNIQFRTPVLDEIDALSRQIKISYTAAYRGLMDDSYLDSLEDDHWCTILREGISNGDICMIATREEKIVGSTVFGTLKTEEGVCAEWHSFYLLPEYVGRGVGHSFYEKIEAEMRAQGCTTCALEVLSANERAIRFYCAHGFTKTDTFTVEENGMTLFCDKMVKAL